MSISEKDGEPYTECMHSCRKKNDKWVVAMDKWQKMTDMEVNKGTFGMAV